MDPDLPSDSDASDADYCPSGEENEVVSEEDNSGEDEGKEDQESDDCCADGDKQKKTKEKKKKRLKPTGKRKSLKRKSAKEVEEEEPEEEPEVKKVCPTEVKEKADSLWASFLNDTEGSKPKRPVSKSVDSPVTTVPLEIQNGTTEKSKKLAEEKENKVTVTQIFEFAGEKVTIEKEVPSEAVKEPTQVSPAGIGGTGRGRGRGRGSGRGGGSSALTSFIGQLGKKGKLNMLEKSKLDWDQFKKKEGIDDDLRTHNKGRDGYLERQDFLQRTDLRQFEIEKDMRAKKSGR